ncbi:MAG TPA: acetyltransferase [Sulfurovum sp. UBA12169]|nr:MAG TPA: acetyltransferase [Sulfurovum sp. UBA12169]
MRKILLAFFSYLKYRNKKFARIGSNCFFKSIHSQFTNTENITIGNNVYIGKNANFDAAGGIEIGNGVVIAPHVTLYTRTHYYDGPSLEALPFDNKMICSPIVIGDYVWIASDVIILPGVTIGKGAVVGAGAVVSKDIPDYAVAVGNPAKVVKFRDRERFETLLQEQEPFVYNKFGHKKAKITQ